VPTWTAEIGVAGTLEIKKEASATGLPSFSLPL